ncbi:septum formation initiator family protein [Candidatus Peregrinibacteria bacterium]|nr:septum formation initiator family protein [Candidatus Peregrinibacteria bacterium]
MALKINPTSNITKLIIVVELILVIYLLNTLTISVYKGYQVDKIINEFEQENKQMEAENKKKVEDYEYFTSPNYIEKMAKQNLGLVNPGEKVIVLPPNPSENSLQNSDLDDKNAALAGLTNEEKWWIFFFDRSRAIK